MPTNDTVISIPFVAGLNQQLDPDQLQPPELTIAENVVARRGGRLEKRSGYHLVGTAEGSGAPAVAFGGSSSTVDGSVEAIGPYHGKDGVRPMLASGNKLYEYVGSDATHGWREVNRLPSFLGTLSSVAATGGVVTEVETLVSADGVYRATIWITGQRNGQELTSDKGYTEQVTGAGNAIYYAVQLVETGAFVKAPTLLSMSDSSTTKAFFNLRVTKLWVDGSSYSAAIAYQSGLLYGVNFCVLNFASGSVTSITSFGTAYKACFRSFDITGLPFSVLGAPSIIYVSGDADTGSSVNPAKLRALLLSVNPSTGATATVDSKTDILGHGTTDYNPWAQRGVVLEQDPATGDVSFAARVISRYYSSPGVATTKLDGQMVLGRMTASPGSLAVSAAQTYIPYLGLQTADSTSSVLASSNSPTYYSGQPTDVSAGVLDIRTSTPFPLASATKITPMVITMTLPDGTSQVYVVQLGETSEFGSFPSFHRQRTIASVQPYYAAEAYEILLSGLYPRPTHAYPQNEKIAAVYTNANQVTQIDLTTAVSNTGFTPGVHAGCAVKNGALTICTATVAVSSTGEITEIAIENGNPGYAFVDSVIPVDITSITGAGPGTLNKAHAYGNLHNAFRALTFNDVPDTVTSTAITAFAQSFGYEMCVHRWSVITASGLTCLALSSTSANTFTTPNGDEPYGAADPHAQNNFFEVYKWDGSTTGALVGTSTTSCLIAALGGPWRLVGGLVNDGGDLLCSISPAGDDFQRSTFLVRVGNVSQSVGIKFPTISDSTGASSFVYSDNPGMFVESSNIMRTTSMPMNVPSLHLTTQGLSAGALRDGASKGTQEVVALDYDGDATAWRKMCRLSDYTYVNGGTLSVFDGVGCNEASSLLWPQHDLVSINWPKYPDVYTVSEQGTAATATTTYQANAFWNYKGNGGRDGFLLVNISRPYFKYEAGFNDKNGYRNPVGNGWGSPISTRWGGDPSKDYTSVYADARTSQIAISGRSSYAYSSTAAADLHYYGRYQSYSSGLNTAGTLSLEVGSCSLWVWAPRANGSWGVLADSVYKPEEAGGDFLLQWVYESSDGTGRMVRSAPSNAVKYTVCAEILGAFYDPNTSSSNNTIAYTGGLVTQFRYGFFAPTLELTNRLKTASADARRVALQPYTTAEPYATVLYRMPLSNFLNSSGDFVVGRNETRGVVAYNNSPFSGGNPLGYVFTNFQCFDGPQKDYNGILSEPFLYTTGNVLDNVAPPSAKVMCVHQNRLIVGGADDATVIWISKELTPTEAPGFNEALTLTISDSGAVTGLASLNGNLVVFKQNAIFVVPGVLPDSTGYAPSMGEPIKLPAGVGCIEPRSVVETPVGVFFVSERGLEILYPTLQVEQIGQKVRETLTTYPNVVSAIHHPNDQEARFLASSADGTSFIIICYSYQFNVWSTHKIGHLGSAQLRMATVDGVPWIAARTPWSPTGGGVAYKQSSVSALDLLPDSTGGSTLNVNYVKMTVATAPIDVHQVQGFQRVKRVRLLMTNNVHPEQTADLLPGVAMFGLTDYNASFTSGGAQASTWTAAEIQSVLTTQGRVQVEMHLREQKGQVVQVAYIEGNPATTPAYTDHGWGLAISNIALVVGLKKNLDKRILPDAKH